MRIFLLGCCIACACFLPAASVVGADDPPAPAFIARTHVIAPRQVGEFVLEATRYDAGNRLAGVMLRYLLPGHDETRFDLFVYPHGQSGIEEALDLGMAAFRDNLAAAARAGHYRALKITQAVEFDIAQAVESVPAFASDQDHDQRQADRLSPSSPDEPFETLLASLLAPAPAQIDGRVIELGFEVRGAAEDDWFDMRSRGYLFYRHLYFFKGRISAAAYRIGQDEFASLADRAMRELVPAVQAYNIGGCSGTTIQIDPDLEERALAEALAKQLVAAPMHNARRATATPRPTMRRWPRWPGVRRSSRSSTPPANGGSTDAGPAGRTARGGAV